MQPNLSSGSNDRDPARTLPLLVLVAGTPGAGKTTLANRLGQMLGFPVISRDTIKALLADAFGFPESVPAQAIARAQFPVFYGLLQHFLRAGVSVIAESALDPNYAVRELRPLLVDAQAVLLHCATVPGENHRRFVERFVQGQRHAIHPDADYIARIDAGESPWAVYNEPLPLGVPTLRIDTTAGYLPALPEIMAFIKLVGKVET